MSTIRSVSDLRDGGSGGGYGELGAGLATVPPGSDTHPYISLAIASTMVGSTVLFQVLGCWCLYF